MTSRRILYVNSFQAPNLVGGAEVAMEALAQAMAQQGHDVAIASLRTDNGSTMQTGTGPERRYWVAHGNLYAPRKRGASPPVRALWHLRDATNATPRRTLQEVFEDFGPDIVHTHNLSGFGTAAWSAAKAEKIPVVHTLHDYYLLCSRGTTFKGASSCERLCSFCHLTSSLKQHAALPDYVIGPSRFIIEFHRLHGWFTKVPAKVVPNILQSKVSASQRPIRPAGRFGYLGRLDPTKGIETILEAARRVPDAEFVIAGRGEEAYEQGLRLQAPPNVRFAGFVPDSGSFLDSLDALIVPSLWREVAALVIREAQQRGVPVIGAGSGGVPELVGNADWLFTPGDSLGLAAKVNGLRLSDNLSVIQEAGRQAAARAAREAIEGHLEVYRSVCP